MDASVSKAVDAYVDSLAAATREDETNAHEELDVDALFDELENEDDGLIRDQRLAQLQREWEPSSSFEAVGLTERLNEIKTLRDKEHGSYTELKDEKTVLEVTTSTSKVVAHFFHKDFRRCQIMHTHLEELAKKHYHTKFIKIDVENVPFLVASLQIRVLPCVIAFIDGIGVDRIVGFEDLGNTDNFSTARLEYRLMQTGVISRPRAEADSKLTSIFGFGQRKLEESGDSDCD